MPEDSRLTAARALLTRLCRRRRRLAAFRRAVAAALWGAGAAAAAGVPAVLGVCGWQAALGVGGGAFFVALAVRPPWKDLPADAETALWLDRRENWRDAASTLLFLTEGPARAESPAGKHFAVWLENLLPAWEKTGISRLPDNARWLGLPLCLLLAEFFLGLAGRDARENPEKNPVPAGGEIRILTPEADARAEKRPGESIEDAARRLGVDVEVLRARLREAEKAQEEKSAKTGAVSGAGNGDGTARAGEVSVSEGKLRFTEKLPELSPAEQARQAARPPVVPEPYIPAVKRYLEMKN